MEISCSSLIPNPWRWVYERMGQGSEGWRVSLSFAFEQLYGD